MTRVLIEVTETAKYVVEVDVPEMTQEELAHAWNTLPPMYPVDVIGTDIVVVDDGTAVASSVLATVQERVEEAMLTAEGALLGIEDRHSPEAHVHQGYIAGLGAVLALIEKQERDAPHTR